jgi:hypothetical protein
MPKTGGRSWRFKSHFRRHAFGWKSQPAISRLQEALAEIKQVARLEPLLAAEGAIALLERISPALGQLDKLVRRDRQRAQSHDSSDAAPVLASADARAMTGTGSAIRLFEAHAADQILASTSSSSAGASCVAPENPRPNGPTA